MSKNKKVEITFTEADESFINIGHIIYKSDKFIFFSSIDSTGKFDGFWLEELSQEREVTITDSSKYLEFNKKFIQSAQKLGFYDPFGLEKLEQKFNDVSWTDDNIVEKILKFIQQESIFARIEVYGGKNNEKNIAESAYREGPVKVKNDIFSILNVKTEDDFLEFEKSWQSAQLKDIFRITFGDLYLNQVQYAMEHEK